MCNQQRSVMFANLRGLLRRNPILRVVVVNGLVGLTAAVLVVAGLIMADAHGLRRLIMTSQGGLLAAGLLFFGFVVTLVSVAIGSAVMSIGSARTPPHDPDVPRVSQPDRSLAIAATVTSTLPPK